MTPFYIISWRFKAKLSSGKISSSNTCFIMWFFLTKWLFSVDFCGTIVRFKALNEHKKSCALWLIKGQCHGSNNQSALFCSFMILFSKLQLWTITKHRFFAIIQDFESDGNKFVIQNVMSCCISAAFPRAVPCVQIYVSNTGARTSENHFARHTNHPISLASFNLKGWNLVCASGWP